MSVPGAPKPVLIPGSFVTIPYTSQTYPSFCRNSAYKTLTSDDLAFFHSVIPSEDGILEALSDPIKESNLQIFNTDWYLGYRGQSRLVLFPETTEQISKILQYCNKERIAVVPQGGNTSVSGGSVPVFDEVILSLKKKNQIKNFDSLSGVLVCDAGCVLDRLDKYVAKHEYQMPIDLASKENCQIGGNCSTNAGGLRFMRFGSLRGNVLGLEVVLADGTVLDGISRMRKDNTGYDIKQLFIGAEGTLGIITEVSIVCPKRRNAINVAFLAFDTFAEVVTAFMKAKEILGEILSAFEVWDQKATQLVQTHLMQGMTYPISSSFGFYALVETAGSRIEHDLEKMKDYLHSLSESNILRESITSNKPEEMKPLWLWREQIPAAVTISAAAAFHYDVSLPITELYSLVDATRKFMEEKGLKDISEVTGFGHMGDGNLHLCIAMKSNDIALRKIADEFIYGFIGTRKGSISGEHGIGLSKRNYLNLSKSETMIKMMRTWKRVLDPGDILNPYKLFPEGGEVIRINSDTKCGCFS